MYDVIIAGSGLGGLLCGYVLAKEGYNVCILEKHHRLGGCLQSFSREGTIFDTGMHYVGSLDEGQIMWQFFRFFGLLDSVKIKKMYTCFDKLHITGKEYWYAQGYDNFVDTLHQAFPNEREALIRFTDMLKNVKKATEQFMIMDISSIDNLPTMKFFESNAFDFIRSISDNTELQQVLSATNSLHFGRASKTSLYVHMVIINSLIESAWRIVDGGSQIAESLAQSIRNFGGTVLTKSGVTRFVMNSADSAVEYVELDNGERLYAKQFISNIHPQQTFRMIQSSLIHNAYIKRIESIEQTIGIFSVYIVLKENTFPYLNYNYYHCDVENTWVADVYDKVQWPSGYMLYTPASSKSNEYADGITIMTFMKYDDVKEWEHTTIEQRGQAYRDFKQQKAEQLIEYAQKHFPGLRSAIKSYYTSTPLTYRDYTGTINGSTYGIMRDCNNVLKTLITPRTKIPNLFLTGQNINLHGVLGVTMGAFITLSNFLGYNYIREKVLKE